MMLGNLGHLGRMTLAPPAGIRWSIFGNYIPLRRRRSTLIASLPTAPHFATCDSPPLPGLGLNQRGERGRPSSTKDSSSLIARLRCRFALFGVGTWASDAQVIMSAVEKKSSKKRKAEESASKFDEAASGESGKKKVKKTPEEKAAKKAKKAAKEAAKAAKAAKAKQELMAWATPAQRAALGWD